MYAGFITDEAANFLRTSANALQRIVHWTHSDCYKNNALGLFLIRWEPIKHWLFQKRNVNQKFCLRKHWHEHLGRSGWETVLTIFFPLLYFLFLIILGITSCPIFIPPLTVNALNFLFLPGRDPSIHNLSTIKSISQYRSLESKLLTYG